MPSPAESSDRPRRQRKALCRRPPRLPERMRPDVLAVRSRCPFDGHDDVTLKSEPALAGRPGAGDPVDRDVQSIVVWQSATLPFAEASCIVCA